MPSNNKSEYVLSWFLKIVVYFIPVLPLYISSSLLFPFITGKNFIFRVLVEIASVLWMCLLVSDRQSRLQYSNMVLTVFTFTLIVGLADLFGVNPYNSFWSTYERMEGYITILHLVLFFLIVKSIFKTKKDWIVFFCLCVATSVLVSFYLIIDTQLFIQSAKYVAEYGTRKGSTIGSPAFLASYLLFSIFLGLMVIYMANKSYIKIFCFCSIFINSVGLYMTASRGAILAGAIGAAAIGIYYIIGHLSCHDRNSIKKMTFPMIICSLIILAIFVISYRYVDTIKHERTISRFIMLFNSDSAVDTRVQAWKLAWNGIKENPVLGWGQENFVGVFSVNEINYERLNAWIDRAHNIIIDWLVSAGILGLLSYLAIYGTAFHILWRNYHKQKISKNESFIYFVAIIVYFLQNLVTFDTINTYIIFFALIAYIDSIEAIGLLPYRPVSCNSHNRIKGVNRFIVTLLILIVFSFVIYYVNYKPIKQLRLYSQISASPAKQESYSNMLNDFDKALSYRSFGYNYIVKEMANVSSQIMKYQLYEKEDALKLIKAAFEGMHTIADNEQYNLEQIIDVYSFYALLASYDSRFIATAEALLEKCLRINPEFKVIEVNKVRLDFLKKDYESAYVKLKKLVNEYPNNFTWHFELALAAILTSRPDLVEEALTKAKGIVVARDNDVALDIKPVFYINQLNRLALAYAEAKNYTQAIDSYNEIIDVLAKYNDVRITKSDERPLTNDEKLKVKAKVYLEIARIYTLLGDMEQAEMEAKKASEAAPELSEQVRKLIGILNK